MASVSCHFLKFFFIGLNPNKSIWTNAITNSPCSFLFIEQSMFFVSVNMELHNNNNGNENNDNDDDDNNNITKIAH